MDFGLTRVIEMFEERFGPKATRALIGLVAVALAAVSIKTIVLDLVVPSFEGIEYLAKFADIDSMRSLPSVRISVVIAALVWLGVGFLAYITAGWFITQMKRRKLDQLAADLERGSGTLIWMYVGIYRGVGVLEKAISELRAAAASGKTIKDRSAAAPPSPAPPELPEGK